MQWQNQTTTKIAQLMNKANMAEIQAASGQQIRFQRQEQP
jgi:hypothetical protein